MLRARNISRDPVRQRAEARAADRGARRRAGRHHHLQRRHGGARMNDVSHGAQHVVSRLMRESLVDKQVIAGTEAPVRAILPNLNVIQIGGLSIMDRGHTALLPLLDEIVANQDELHAGDRRRARACARGTSSRSGSISACRPARSRRSRRSPRRRTPTWCRACWRTTASSISRRRSSCSCCPRCWRRRAARCSTASRPTICGSIRPRVGKIPPHGSDAGSYLVGEVFGARVDHPAEGRRRRSTPPTRKRTRARS